MLKSSANSRMASHRSDPGSMARLMQHLHDCMLGSLLAVQQRQIAHILSSMVTESAVFLAAASLCLPDMTCGTSQPVPIVAAGFHDPRRMPCMTLPAADVMSKQTAQI